MAENSRTVKATLTGGISPMRVLILSVGLFSSAAAFAVTDTIKFDYPKGEDIQKIVQDYARASGERFMLDPAVHGKIAIFNPGPVTLSEAYNQLCAALAVNGIGISRQGDVQVVMQARTVQRSAIPVVHELPSVEPVRMVTWLVTLKYASADEVNKQLRMLTSKDGEEVPILRTNQLLISDWTSNLHRVAEILAEVDKKQEK
jgi:general secretion pathway protein D